MSSRWGSQLRNWARIAVIVIVVSAMVFSIAWAAFYFLNQHQVVVKATLLTLIFAIPALAVALVPIARRRPTHGLEQLEEFTAALAAEVGRQETEQYKRLLGSGPEKIPQRINVGFEYEAMPSMNAQGARATGCINDIHNYYYRLKPRRLAIIGQPGSGKTVLALVLLLEILEKRAPGEPVPVRFSLSRWEKHRALDSWLADQLVSVYGLPRQAASGLLERGLIIPVLDGLDEMDREDRPPVRATAALLSLNSRLRHSHAAPLILTCREDQYRRLARRPDLVGSYGTRLLHAATVRVLDVSPRQAVGYLKEQIDPRPWQPVIHDLGRKHGSVLASVLNTPWRLTLAVTVDRAPGQLIEHSSDMDEYLLEDYVRASTVLHPRSKHRQYNHEVVAKWLTELARYLQDNVDDQRELGNRSLSGEDIVLHELWPIAGPRTVLSTDAALAAVMSLPAFLWIGAFVFSHAAYWRFIFVVILLGWIAAILRRAYAYWIPPQPFDYRQLLSWHALLQLCVGACVGIAVAVFFGSWAWGAAAGLGAWIAAGISATPTQGLVTNLATARKVRESSPRTPLRNELTQSVIAGLAGGPLVALAFSQYLGPVAGWLCGLSYALAVGLTVATGSWRRYLATLLCTRRRLPWRLGEFLDWASDAGLMRVSGIAYQFRHDELQKWLAGSRAFASQDDRRDAGRGSA